MARQFVRQVELEAAYHGQLGCFTWVCFSVFFPLALLFDLLLLSKSKFKEQIFLVLSYRLVKANPFLEGLSQLMGSDMLSGSF